jgi:23S rRNA (uracil1939-C5)-methyltransferase
MRNNRHRRSKSNPPTANAAAGAKPRGAAAPTAPSGRRGGASARPDPAPPAWAAELPVREGGEYVVDVAGLGHDGEGVGRYEGYTLFVPGALPGERVRVRVGKVKKQYGFASLLDVVEPSADRVAPPCAVYDACGGCQLQHLSYEAQLRAKRRIVVDALQRIGKLAVASADSAPTEAGGSPDAADRPPVIVHPTIGMADPWRYRNKVQVPIGEQQGGLIGGFYEQGSHRIVDMDACLIQQEESDEIVLRVKRIGSALGLTAYREDTHTGLLRHVVVRTARRTGEIMVVLVTNGDRLPNAERLVEAIREAVPGVVSVCQNINTARTNVVFGGETRVLWGQEVIYDYIGDVKFAISPRSFFQVNPVQTEVLYGKALEYAALSGEETVIDAYCGIGTISLFLAKRARRVYGVEIVPEAIADARRNAELNGMPNVEFAVGEAETVLPRWLEEGVAPDVVVVDPPRKGCDPALLDTLLAMKPPRVVYVSCNPATLARDLRVLEDGGYRTVEVQPVDMFPHTVHVECCVLIERSK